MSWLKTSAIILLLMTAMVLLAGDDLYPLRSLIDGRLRLDIDHGPMSYLIENGRSFWRDNRSLWGYDPFLLGGMADPLIWNGCIHMVLFTLITPFLSTATALNLYILIMLLLIPVLLLATGRRHAVFLSRPPAALLFAWLGICLFRAGLLSKLFHSGMIGASFITFLSLFALSVLADYLEHGRRRDLILLYVLAPLALLVHRISVFTLALPALVMAIVYLRHARPARYLQLSAVAAVTLLVNSFWIVPMLMYFDLANFNTTFSHWHNPDLLAFVKDLIDPGAQIGSFHRPTGWSSLVFRIALYGLMVYGLILGYRKDRRKTVAWGSAWGIVYLLAYFGGRVPLLHKIDPSVYVNHAEVLALPAACWAVQSLVSRLTSARRRAAVTVTVLALAALPALLPPLTPLINADRHHPPDEGRLWHQLSDTILDTERSGGRITFEGYNLFRAKRDPLPNDKTLYGHLILPSSTGAVFLGGHYPNLFLFFNEANFAAGYLGTRPIESFSREQLQTYLNAYNVDLIIAHSKPALQTLAEKLPEAELVWQVGPHHAFRYNPTGDYFAHGAGRIELAHGRIHLSDLVPGDDGRVIIKFHYVDGLEADDGSPVSPVQVPGAVLPLIAVEPRSTTLTLSM